jgi:flagellar hook-associated protein 2
VAGNIVESNASSAFTSGGGVTVFSSRRTAVSAEPVDGSSRSRSAAFEVKVRNLARAQVNRGQELASAASNGIDAGANTFTVKVGTTPATTIAFTNDSTDTNAEALESLASAINDADTGITASVVEDTEAGTVRLDLTASETGVAHAFEVADVSGNVMEAVEIGSATTGAENAEFVVNGVAGVSSSNSVLIDNGRVRLTLRAATGPTADDDEVGAIISVGADPVSAAVLELASSLNGLRDLLRADGSASSLRTLGSFDTLFAGIGDGLDSVGVSIDRDGRLHVDRERLETATANDRGNVAQVLSGADGLPARISGIAGEALGGVITRTLHDGLLASGTLLVASPLMAAPTGSQRGLLVDILG